ncbi:MAG: PLDc N-terminal domain-containing protein [Actinomycetales bacterium]|nr:PLDc N-terminal domain-containing protein [Actinomycetales bacterium]
MLRVLGVIILLAVYIWFLVDVVRTPRLQARRLPKWLWLLIVVILPIAGGLLWLAFGRARPSAGTRRRRRAPIAPDDDPRFLRELDEQAWRQRMRQRRGETGPDQTPA